MSILNRTDHGEVLFTVRPRRMALYARISATLVVVTGIVVGVLLRSTPDGVSFRLADQVAFIIVAFMLGAGILTMARPRLLITPQGVWVRGVLGENFYGWPLILRVAFPQGALYAQLVMPDDEIRAVMAIQAMDKQFAVDQLARVREFRDRFGPAPTTPRVSDADREREALIAELNRPLGRLELIDREMRGRKQKKRKTSTGQLR